MSIGKDHRVELERYSGPLELLLWLIREEEVDVHDIPIARILDRYLEMLQTIEVLDLDEAGEFLVMASLLMQIKSRSLLPRDEPLDDEDLDPRFELVKMLLEYRRFKDVSEELRVRSEEWSLRFTPGKPPEFPNLPPDEVPIADVTLWDLALAFQNVMNEIGTPGPRAIVYDDTPIEVRIEEILARMAEVRRLPFSELFRLKADRLTIVGIFIALLELIKQRRVRAVQPHPFAPIEVERVDGDGPGPHVE